MRPATIVGIGAGLSLLALLGAIADWERVATVASGINPALLAVIAAGHLVGFGCRAARWLLMLRASGLRLPWRRALAAYFGAELLGPLPASPLVASYFLHRGGDAPVSATAPVIVAGLWVDVMVVVGGTAVLPVGTPPAVRSAAAALCACGVLAVLGLHWSKLNRLLVRLSHLLARLGRRLRPSHERWWETLEHLVSRQSERVAVAFRPQVLAPALLLTVIPMAVGTAITALVASTLGFPQLTAAHAWAAAGTVMVLALVSPLPFDLGVTEGAGVVAYSWAGVPTAAALTLGLLGRFTSLTFGLTFALLATWFLRRELH
ncbi:MAG TPA: lysylphosphatidylglycerol synthase transmembrane domain-containing protein [Chloroflexota bacterium]|nr:lysylphosphatidylglycerol synthase transmembrane domain-containing protein [Chloroflexota bacterium]